MASEELAVFAREDVVGHGGDAVLLAEGEAELQHQGGLAGADRAENVVLARYACCDRYLRGLTHQCQR